MFRFPSIENGSYFSSWRGEIGDGITYPRKNLIFVVKEWKVEAGCANAVVIFARTMSAIAAGDSEALVQVF